VKHVAFLRAVNVAGHNRLPMAKLRAFFAGLGFAEARSLLQSGNVVFSGGSRTAAQLEHFLERETAARLGLQTSYFVRSSKELSELIKRNPLRLPAGSDPSRLVVVLLKEKPQAAAVAALRAAHRGPEILGVRGRHAYVFYPEGIGRATLTTAVIEAKLRARGTGRNWNTLLRLAAMIR
jgi:uncharacterized protein (DUF1697 family)